MVTAADAPPRGALPSPEGPTPRGRPLRPVGKPPCPGSRATPRGLSAYVENVLQLVHCHSLTDSGCTAHGVPAPALPLVVHHGSAMASPARAHHRQIRPQARPAQTQTVRVFRGAARTRRARLTADSDRLWRSQCSAEHEILARGARRACESPSARSDWAAARPGAQVRMRMRTLCRGTGQCSAGALPSCVAPRA